MSEHIQNVVLLTIDSLGASRVGCLGYNKETTPNLDDVAKEGTVYTACIAQSSHTLESMPSLLCSKYPSRFDSPPKLPTTFQTIASTLSDLGFATAGFHSNPYISRAYGFERGFDTFDDSLPLARNRAIVFLHRVYNHFKNRPYRRASKLNELGLNWLEETKSDRQFLWLHYMDPHGPYLPPKEFQQSNLDRTLSPSEGKDLWRKMIDKPESISQRECETLIALHDAVIQYMDAAIGRFLDKLERSGLADSTLVVIAADHGELFGEHGRYGHPRRLYEELIHVPLWLRGPTIPSDKRVDTPVENIDILPTILDQLGQSVPTALEGDSLFDIDNRQPDSEQATVFAETREEETNAVRYAVRTAKYKLRVREAESGDIEVLGLHDLSEDEPETRDIQDTKPTVRSRLLTRLDEHTQSVKASGETTEDVDDVDDVVQDRLEELGYK